MGRKTCQAFDQTNQSSMHLFGFLVYIPCLDNVICINEHFTLFSFGGIDKWHEYSEHNL